MAIEQPRYTVVVDDGACEIRAYDPMIVAVSVESDLRGYSGFSNVFDYIQGNNTTRQKIAMTAPVINDLEKTALTTAFVMPKAYRMDELPQPQSTQLRLDEKPARLVAAIRFSGSVNDRLITQKRSELLAWIKANGYFAIGSTELARYNPPFIPGLFKRNELWIEVAALPKP